MKRTLWSEPRNTLNYERVGDHRFITFEELLEIAGDPDNTRRIAKQDAPFLVTPHVPTWIPAEFTAEEMLNAYLNAHNLHRLAAFADSWALPSLIEPGMAGGHLYVSYGHLTAERTRLRWIATIMGGTTCDQNHEMPSYVRLDSETGELEVLRPFDEVQIWQGTGVRVPASTDAEGVVQAAARVLRTLATAEISALLERHTRNTLQHVGSGSRPDFVRVADPFGTMALELADRLIGGKHIKKCALDTCGQFFFPQYRDDQQYCRKSHANSASNKRTKRSRA